MKEMGESVEVSGCGMGMVSARVFCTRTIERSFDVSNVILGPFFVWQANGLRV
jgi:purine-nucleoside phosphorylase